MIIQVIVLNKDDEVNAWIKNNRERVEIIDIKISTTTVNGEVVESIMIVYKQLPNKGGSWL